MVSPRVTVRPEVIRTVPWPAWVQWVGGVGREAGEATRTGRGRAAVATTRLAMSPGRWRTQDGHWAWNCSRWSGKRHSKANLTYAISRPAGTDLRGPPTSTETQPDTVRWAAQPRPAPQWTRNSRSRAVGQGDVDLVGTAIALQLAVGRRPGPRGRPPSGRGRVGSSGTPRRWRTRRLPRATQRRTVPRRRFSIVSAQAASNRVTSSGSSLAKASRIAGHGLHSTPGWNCAR